MGGAIPRRAQIFQMNHFGNTGVTIYHLWTPKAANWKKF
jgi:hypothetical protein